MAIVNIKIVGIDGDSVLVKYSSENSKKSIDDYDAVAYQPKSMGYTNLDDFIEGIKPSLLLAVEKRDAAESITLDLSSWEGHESTHNVIHEEYTTLENIQFALGDSSAEVVL